MPVSNADIAALPTYTAAEQLKMWQKASIDLSSAGVSYAIDGRSLNRSDASEVRSMIVFWTAQAASEESNDYGDGIALVQFGRVV